MSDLYDGRENDKTITAEDDFTYDIMAGKLSKVAFKMYDKHGVVHWFRGGYLITDGGYCDVPCFVDPLHNACGHKEVHWSEFLESVRKDVECLFGMLKQRFRILRNGMAYDRDCCNDIVKTCGIMHNMLLAYDGLDEFEWNKSGDWELEDPDMEDSDIYWHDSVLEEFNQITVPALPPGCTTRWKKDFDPISRMDHTSLKAHLVDHFFHQWRYGQLQWPRRFDTGDKTVHPMNRILQALSLHTYEALYSKPTDLIRLLNDGVTKGPRVTGKGLFCSMLLPGTKKGIKLAEFVGDKVMVRITGEYVIKTQSGWLNCLVPAVNGSCKASMANSAKNCWNRCEDKAAQNNCVLKVRGHVATLYTKPYVNIPPNRELLWNYGSEYVLPPLPNTLHTEL
jgi:hypothetical protein